MWSGGGGAGAHAECRESVRVQTVYLGSQTRHSSFCETRTYTMHRHVNGGAHARAVSTYLHLSRLFRLFRLFRLVAHRRLLRRHLQAHRGRTGQIERRGGHQGDLLRRLGDLVVLDWDGERDAGRKRSETWVGRQYAGVHGVWGQCLG